MNNLPWTPWHKVVSLRPDLRSGELSLASFAADLYDVAMQRGLRPAYEDPAEFFALTYPTYNLRELARDVVLRLAGQNDKAVRQLALTYGGGKTHTLITLYHLVNDPERLPSGLPAVQEFLSEIGIPLPRARIACLTFDKLDVEKGMQTRAPDGEARWLKHPWSVLAFQLAGADGLRLLHAENLDAERESAPAENLLETLLAMPGKEGLSTLVLMDEVLMYAREKVGLAPVWEDRLTDFFHYLTQAATKVDRACLVVSLLATDPHKYDQLGKQVSKSFEDIFTRQKEESIQPVVKEDVAEVLRRRLFTPDSIRERESFRPHVVTALKGIEALDPQTRQEGKAAEERFLKSYPFHPDLTEVFYTKWTQMEGFQRTRGVLRTFALALREAEKWDTAPLVAANAFLCEPGVAAISEAARELASVATAEEYEGRTQQWSAIILSELEKALDVQREYPALQGREIEQAVIATFLHSQPIGQRVQTRELLLLVGATRPDKIELEKALKRWTALSWFLDDTFIQHAGIALDGSLQLPQSWRLGSKPNLTQMHHDACRSRIPEEVIETRLLDEIGRLKSLTVGASAMGVRVHNLPEWPKQVEDNGEFHFVILGPKAASSAGKPSSEAQHFIQITTAADRPRVYRNAVVQAVPSVDGLEAARNAILKYMGWEEVRSQLKDQQVDPTREALLSGNLDAARKMMPDAIRQSYCIAVAVDEHNQVQAYKLTLSGDPLFTIIKGDTRLRIQETSVSADALLPGGPYDLWREGDTARRLKDLVTAFAQFPHLPKMLNRQAILDTLVDGCRQGLFVLRLPRPDNSFRTFWRQTPGEDALKETAMEVVLPGQARLAEIDPGLLAPNRLPGLWQAEGLIVGDIYQYFSGQTMIQIQKEGYEEPLMIPGAEQEVVDAAIQEAVKQGIIWLVSGPASIYAEEIPVGLLTPDVQLYPPPTRISTMDVLPARLPAAWKGEETSALAISTALAAIYQKPLPWRMVKEALDGAFNTRYLERTVDSHAWPCDYGGAQYVKVRAPKDQPPPPPLPPSGAHIANAELSPSQIQDLAETIGDVINAAAGHDITFMLKVEMGKETPAQVVEKVSEKLMEVNEGLGLI